ncbi:FecR domain-containing protein [Ramlibacter sp. AN1015]|uniref:FecR family protein n=1 Tax=Ramlibacter sp. AN1015 TaxID=3133428 RepID=UPI0030C58188
MRTDSPSLVRGCAGPVLRSLLLAGLALAATGLRAQAPAPASAPASAPAQAGEVSHLQGMATAQQPGGDYRFLGKGDPVLEGDTLSTTERGFAVLTLRDGSKYTLRPATSFTVERFAHGEGAESAWLRLIKGGVRVVTGLVGKRNPAGVELRTPTATIGIRGTSFDARLCGDDCRTENSAPVTAAPAIPQPVAARVVQLTGQASATSPARVSRALAVGGTLFEGEEVRTAAGSTLVLGFRDQSVVSVNPETVLRISAFSFNQPQAPNGMTLGLLRGGLRALTGLIGRQSPEAVKIKTTTSTIGVRGTGMDISCEGPCADPALSERCTAGGTFFAATCFPDPAVAAAEPGAANLPEHGLFMRTWQGTTYFERGPLDVALEQAGFIGADGLPRVLRVVPPFLLSFTAPRPDSVAIDWDALFASVDPAGADGLYVYVREGHVFVRSGASTVELGPGESAWSGREGDARRIQPVPRFLLLDPIPIPESFSGTSGLLQSLFGGPVGQAGQEICRL